MKPVNTIYLKMPWSLTCIKPGILLGPSKMKTDRLLLVDSQGIKG